MKNIAIGILIAIILAGIAYWFFWMLPESKDDKTKLSEADQELVEHRHKLDSIRLITDLLNKDIDSITKKAESYAKNEKEALKRAEIEHKKYLNLKNTIPKDLQECMDLAQETEAHLINEVYNADEAYKYCDSARAAITVALVKCKEIPNIDTGINDIINDINKSWEKKADAMVKEQKQKDNKKIGIVGIVLFVIGLAL